MDRTEKLSEARNTFDAAEEGLDTLTIIVSQEAESWDGMSVVDE
jgi:hypothetical protein